MSWHYSQALVAAFSEQGSLDGKQCARLKSIRTAERSCFDGKKRASYRRSLSGMTYEPSMAALGVARWMSSLRASPVSRSVQPDDDGAWMISETSGLKRLDAFAKYDPDSRFWKTYLDLWPLDTSQPFWGNWPKTGSMQAGLCWELMMLGRTIGASGSGLWSTPRASERQQTNSQDSYVALSKQVLMWPTPSSRDWKSSNASRQTMDRNARPLNETITQGHGGQLNPTWVEWLMGWPLEWTDLEPLATDRFRQWLEQHGGC